ncbi:hypothetical protein BY996DRAFT_8689146 [Phakopsora pachyrhizi]|nr:hypothetical protein BY996DRAFT_8689146 [Phakopsora pachyrhizi]
MRPGLTFRATKHLTLSIARVYLILTWKYCWTSYKGQVWILRKLLAWQDVCDLHTKDESLGLIGFHWDMVDKLPLVMTNPTIKPMSSIICDAIGANSSLDLKPLMLKVPQSLSSQHILYSNTAATPYSNINNYNLTMTHGTDSSRGEAESNRRSRLRRKGAIHRSERTLQRSEDIVIPIILRNSSSSFSFSSENRPTTRTSVSLAMKLLVLCLPDLIRNKDFTYFYGFTLGVPG